MKRCKYIIKKDDDLIKFLNNQGISKSKIKSLIKYRTIKINDTVVTKLPQFLNLGDTVTINEQISTDIDINKTCITIKNEIEKIINKNNFQNQLSEENNNKEEKIHGVGNCSSNYKQLIRLFEELVYE